MDAITETRTIVDEAIGRECAACDDHSKLRRFAEDFLRNFRDDGKTWPVPSYIRIMIKDAKKALEG